MPSERSNLYHALAEALAPPSVGMEDSQLVEAALPMARESQTVRSAIQALLEVDLGDADSLRNHHMALMSGPGPLSLRMYESGAREGRLISASTFAVERWYREAGLETRSAELPDHVSLELEFLSFVSDHDSDAWSAIERTFLDLHAGRWLPSLGRELAATGDPFYAPIGQLLAGWLEVACQQLGVPGFLPPRKPRRSGINSRFPAIERAADCTLCSFCVPACPSGALTIQENEHETRLVLSSDGCIGCGKCVRACQTGALEMQRTLIEGSVLLFQSERVACRSCGSPMVSQAELDYVAGRLDHPEWLEYCPQCRTSRGS